MPTWTLYRKNWKTTSTICRIWNSPSRTVSCGCYRPVTENVPEPLWWKWLSICWNKVWSMKKQLCCVRNRLNWTSCSIRYSIKKLWKKLTLLPKVCRLLRVLPAGVSYSSPTKPKNGKTEVKKWFWYARKLLPKTCGVWTYPKESWPHAVVWLLTQLSLPVVWVNVVYPAQEIS